MLVSKLLKLVLAHACNISPTAYAVDWNAHPVIVSLLFGIIPNCTHIFDHSLPPSRQMGMTAVSGFWPALQQSSGEGMFQLCPKVTLLPFDHFYINSASPYLSKHWID
jgi:hypothetical protein